MNKMRWLVAVLGLGIAMLFAPPALAQHDDHNHGHEGHEHGDEDHDHGDDAEAEMIAKWMEMMSPGPHHKHLEALVGDWNYVTKWRMSPEAPWSESKGTSKYEKILDGRYVTQHVIADDVDPGMQSRFEAHGVFGYDNLKQKHFFGWIDNMATGLMTSEGSCDDSGKVITYHGEQINPMNGKNERYKSVLRFINPNKTVFEMYGPDESGKEFMSLEVTSTRK